MDFKRTRRSINKARTRNNIFYYRKIISKGGIAFEFVSRISPELYYQRLKKDEAERLTIGMLKQNSIENVEESLP